MASQNGHEEGELLDYEEEMEEQVSGTEGDQNQEPMDEVGLNMLQTPYHGHVSLHTAGFKDMLLKPEILKGICDAGFEHPSEVQSECIPKAMSGIDILCQAKSGMGKTAVFVISTLQIIDTDDHHQPTVLVLAPTRELAYQIAAQYKRFKRHLRVVRMGLFYGGTPMLTDIQSLRSGLPVHVVVGTPGRLRALVRERVLDLSHIKCFILDECDKMLGQQDMAAEVQEIYLATPYAKQVMLFSATVNKENLQTYRRFLGKDAFELLVDDPAKLVLKRLIQHYKQVVENRKFQMLRDILDIIEFNQVVVFANTVVRAQTLGAILAEDRTEVIMIHSAMTQEERLARYQMFVDFKKRILVATDLFGRGMDIERVNVVINYDCPTNADTYLHRIARAGRFGTRGLAITFLADATDAQSLTAIQDRYDTDINPLPDQLDPTLYNNEEAVESSSPDSTDSVNSAT